MLGLHAYVSSSAYIHTHTQAHSKLCSLELRRKVRIQRDVLLLKVTY